MNQRFLNWKETVHKKYQFRDLWFRVANYRLGWIWCLTQAWFKFKKSLEKELTPVPNQTHIFIKKIHFIVK